MHIVLFSNIQGSLRIFLHELDFFQTGLIYVFNIIVGTGALTLPAAFNRSGWALGSILICFLAFVR